MIRNSWLRSRRFLCLVAAAALMPSLSVNASTALDAKAQLESASVDPSLPAPTTLCGRSDLNSVTITWDVQYDSRVTGYVSQYRPAGTTDWLDGPASVKNSVSVPGTNGISYDYRVASTNSAGDRSEWNTSYCLIGWGAGFGAPFPSSTGSGLLATRSVIALAAGELHSCAVTSDETAACWGYNASGQLGNGSNDNSINTPVAVAGGVLTNERITAITVGTSHSCALTVDGAVACWGDNSFGQLGNGTTSNSSTPVAVTGGALTDKTVTAITAGNVQTCALAVDGTVACWGYNVFGQLGNGTTTDSSTPVAVTGGALTNKTVTAITAGTQYSCALTTDGTVACWGYNSFGQLGDGTGGTSYIPVAAAGGALTNKTVTAIAAGEAHTCALATDGTLSCWGANSSGQLGNGTTNNSNTPVAAGGGALTNKTVTAITAGEAHTCAVTTDGILSCWGGNSSGQLGNGTTNNSNTPIPVTGGALTNKTVTAVTAGAQYTCALPTHGSAACWGYNGNGQLGDGTATTSNEPVAVTAGALAGKRVAAVSTSSGSHTCAATDDGTAACWGKNSYGQLGNGTTTATNTPVAVTGGAVATSTVTAVATGFAHTCALLDDGVPACWGRNDYGQLGDGTTLSSAIPVAVTGGALAGKEVNAVTAAGYHSCAVTTDGTAACWGYNEGGQLGDGSTTTSEVPVAVDGGALADETVTAVTAGGSYSCAVTADGTAACWGDNSVGQLGDGTTTASSAPVAVTGGALTGKKVIAVTASGYHSCAVTDDGIAACWGSNNFGQLGNGNTTRSSTPVAVKGDALIGKKVIAVTAGNEHTCAVATDGTTVCWGRNFGGQLGDGTTTSSNTPIAVTGGALTGGGVSALEAGDSTLGVWSGRLSPGERSTPARSVSARKVAGGVRLIWQPPSRSGAGPVTGYEVEGSKDLGRSWVAVSSFGNVLSAVVPTPLDGFWSYRVRAVTAAGAGRWSVSSNEVLVTTGTRTTKSNVSVEVQTVEGDPVIGTSVSWATPDGQLSGVSSAATNGSGVATLPIVATGAVTFSLSGGRVGDGPLLLSSATLTSVVNRSGSQVTITTPTTPTVVSRIAQVRMPDGSGVPDTTLSIHGGIASDTQTGSSSNLRTFTTDWTYDNHEASPVTDGGGNAIITGLDVPSVGADVTAVFEDGFLRQRVSASLVTPVVRLEFEQMPLVTIISPDPAPVNPENPVEIVVRVVDGTGDPIVGSEIDLERVGPRRAALTGASARGCIAKLSGSTNSSGRLKFRVCASTTSKWRADGANLVPSKPTRIRVRKLPSAPTRITAKVGDRSVSLTWAAPARTGDARISDYRVQRSVDNGKTWTTVADGVTPKKWARVTGLINGRGYRFRIRAVTAVGAGPASKPTARVVPRPSRVLMK